MTMKRIFLTLLISLFAIGISNAQDLAQLTEVFNNAATLLNNGQKEEALTGFEQAMASAAILGEEGLEIANSCKGIIPDLALSIAKGYYNSQNIPAAIAAFEKAAELATTCGNDLIAEEAKNLIVNIQSAQLMASANALFNEKRYEEAVEAYKAILETNPDNGAVLMRLGMSQMRTGDLDGAIANLENAAEKLAGDAAQVAAIEKQMSNAYVTKANNAIKAKDYKAALENAQKSAEKSDNANAQRIIGTAALQLKQNKLAVEGFEAYLALNPEAKDKNQIIYQLGVACAGAGDNAKACGYFKEIASDPKFGEGARYQLTVLKCN